MPMSKIMCPECGSTNLKCVERGRYQNTYTVVGLKRNGDPRLVLSDGYKEAANAITMICTTCSYHWQRLVAITGK